MALENADDALVQVPAPAAQQGAVGGVLHQGMLEQVGGVRRHPAADHETGPDKLVESGQEVLVPSLPDRGEQVVGELPSDGRTDLSDLLRGRAKAVEARHQQGLQGRRHRGAGPRRDARRAGRALRFDHRLGQFLDEQRHAVGSVQDLGHELGRQSPLAGDPIDQRGSIAFVETIQQAQRDVRLTGPWRIELGPERHDDEHG